MGEFTLKALTSWSLSHSALNLTSHHEHGTSLTPVIAVLEVVDTKGLSVAVAAPKIRGVRFTQTALSFMLQAISIIFICAFYSQ